MDIINLLNDDVTTAMEADDITGDVTNQAATGAGGDADDPDGDNIDNRGEISMNTDDLLGTQNTNTGNDNGNDQTQKDPTQTDDMNNGMDENAPTDDMNGEENPEGEMDDMNGDTPEEDGENQDNDDEFSKTRKAKLKSHFLHLYEVIDNAIELVSAHLPTISDDETIHTLSNITSNLTDSKNIIYTVLTEEFQKSEYHTLLKKYIGLNRIYDLQVKTLEKYYEYYDKKTEKENHLKSK